MGLESRLRKVFFKGLRPSLQMNLSLYLSEELRSQASFNTKRGATKPRNPRRN